MGLFQVKLPNKFMGSQGQSEKIACLCLFKKKPAPQPRCDVNGGRYYFQ